MRHLVLANGNKVRTIEQDVRRLQQRIAEEAVGIQVLFAQLLLLVLVGGNALQPAERGKHAKEKIQLGVLVHMRLHEDGALAWVKSGGEEIERHLADVFK